MPKERFTNTEIVTLAVYILGGQSKAVDTEDVAFQANKIAPGRFAWRKYPGQISIDTVRKRLWDAARPDKEAFLVGSERDGWLLTEKGVEFAKEHKRIMNRTDLSRRPLTKDEQRWFRRERERLLASEAYAKFHAGNEDAVTLREAETFFRVDEYVFGEARERKVLQILNSFKEDAELGELVCRLAKLIRKVS